MMVCSRVKVTSPPPAAAMSKCFAYEQRAKLGLAERAEELGEPAMCNVEFQRLLIVAAHLHRDVVLGDFGHGGVHGRPFAARAAIDAVGYGGEQLF